MSEIPSCLGCVQVNPCGILLHPEPHSVAWISMSVFCDPNLLWFSVAGISLFIFCGTNLIASQPGSQPATSQPASSVGAVPSKSRKQQPWFARKNWNFLYTCSPWRSPIDQKSQNRCLKKLRRIPSKVLVKSVRQEEKIIDISWTPIPFFWWSQRRPETIHIGSEFGLLKFAMHSYVAPIGLQ